MFDRLCFEKGVTMRQVSRDTGLSISTLSAFKNGGTPRNNTLKKLADYFEVSTDYLMGKTENKKDIPIEEDVLDDQLVAMLKKLDDNQVQRVMDFVQGMLAK